jgi:hypothetical protein
MYLYVPRPSAVDLNVRDREKIGHYFLGSGHDDFGRSHFGSTSTEEPARDRGKFQQALFRCNKS